MKLVVIKPSWVFMLMAAALIGNGQAMASSADSGETVQAIKVKKKAGSGGQIKFLQGSEETTKERSSRLKRECKGRVNAGACEGYAI